MELNSHVLWQTETKEVFWLKAQNSDREGTGGSVLVWTK